MSGWGLVGRRLWVWAVVGVLAVAGMRWGLDRNPLAVGKDQTGAEIDISTEAVSRLNLGFQAVLADWYWIGALLYVGGEARRFGGTRVGELPRLAGLLQKTVALDSRHFAAWRFGAIFLSEVNPEEAVRFIREGIRQHPQEWRLVADEAFILWRAGRYRESARSWQRGATMPAAPPWLEPMAAIVLGEGGEVGTARLIFRHLVETTDDPFVREVCLVQLERLNEAGSGLEKR